MAAALFFWWLVGHRLELVLDEGIYLEGAERVLAGSLPYRDFFALTGPGVFWDVALFFKLFGVKLSSARILLVLDLAVLTACVYWLSTLFLPAVAALWLTGLYAALLILYPGNLSVNHRWDSGALCLLAVCLLMRRNFFTAGAALAYAAWITPTCAALLFVVLIAKRRDGALIAAGVFAVSLPVLLYLASTSSFFPMLQHLQWSAANYSRANHVFYGDLFAGYGELFKGAHGLGLALMVVFSAIITLPASMPIIAVAGFYFCRQRMPSGSGFLLCANVVAVLISYPRMDIAHLEFATCFSYVMAAAVLSRLLPIRVWPYVFGSISFVTLFFAFGVIQQRLNLETLESRVGKLYGNQQQIAVASSLQRAVNQGETLFSFPYMPIAYFLTQAHNVTRYSYLQPGMMTKADESTALAELQANPPTKVLYSRIDQAQLLRLFPSTPPNRRQLPLIDKWLQECYEPDKSHSLAVGAPQLLIRRRRQ